MSSLADRIGGRHESNCALLCHEFVNNGPRDCNCGAEADAEMVRALRLDTEDEANLRYVVKVLVALERGGTIGNHTSTERDVCRISADTISKILLTRAALEEATDEK